MKKGCWYQYWDGQKWVCEYGAECKFCHEGFCKDWLGLAGKRCENSDCTKAHHMPVYPDHLPSGLLGLIQQKGADKGAKGKGKKGKNP